MGDYGMMCWDATGKPTFRYTSRYMRTLYSAVLTSNYNWLIPEEFRVGVELVWWTSAYGTFEWNETSEEYVINNEVCPGYDAYRDGNYIKFEDNCVSAVDSYAHVAVYT